MGGSFSVRKFERQCKTGKSYMVMSYVAYIQIPNLICKLICGFTKSIFISVLIDDKKFL